MEKSSKYPYLSVCVRHGGDDPTVNKHRCGYCEEEQDIESAKRYDEQQREHMRENWPSIMLNIGIGRRFADKDFANFICEHDEQRSALAVCNEYSNEFQTHHANGNSLILSGKPGTGKTHLATAIIADLVRRSLMRCSCTYLTARELIFKLRASWNGEAPSEESAIKELAKRDLLVIDEIGSQFGSEAELVQLFAVMDARYREQRPMILISNLNRGKLQEFIGERAFDRLREGGTWVSFDWESHRKASV